MIRFKLSMRTGLLLVTVAACFAAFVRSWFADSVSLLDLLPLVVAVAIVTGFFLVRAVDRGSSSVLRLIVTGAMAAFFTTTVFGVAASILWSASVYADDSKGFLISPWVIVSLYLLYFGSGAAVIGAFAGGLCHVWRNLSDRRSRRGLRCSAEDGYEKMRDK